MPDDAERCTPPATAAISRFAPPVQCADRVITATPRVSLGGDSNPRLHASFDVDSTRNLKWGLKSSKRFANVRNLFHG